MQTGLSELVRTRELTANLVRRDLKVRHRGSFLGMLWSLTTPLLFVGLYYFIFKFVFRAALIDDLPRPDGNNVPFAVYFFAGLTLWNFVNSAVSSSTGSVTGSGYLLGKVYFPRAILPLSTVLSSLVTFAFELAVLLVVTLVFVGVPSLHLLWLPLIVVIACVLTFGMALLLSAVTVFLRDVGHFIGVFMQLWFWATPVIYSLNFLKDPGIKRLIELNPVTGLVVSFRNVVVLNRPPRLDLMAYDTLFAVGFLVLGALVFNKSQRLFSEIV